MREKKVQTVYIVGKTLVSAGFMAIAIVHYFGTPDKSLVLLLPALAFCFCGDIALAFSDELNNTKKGPQFTLGIGLFAVAHLLFCIELIRLIDFQFKPTVLFAVAAVVIVIINEKLGMLDYGPLRIPAYVYSFMVGGFCGLGINYILVCGTSAPVLMVGIGSFFFMISDLILSFRCFCKTTPPKWITPVVLATYYLATYMIALSI
jgi:YhhN-like protein.